MLNPAERKALKARAHKLEAVVMIGEIDRALAAHELVKVRAAGLEREAREQALSAICQKTAADAVQQVGKIFVIFRKNP